MLLSRWNRLWWTFSNILNRSRDTRRKATCAYSHVFVPKPHISVFRRFLVRHGQCNHVCRILFELTELFAKLHSHEFNQDMHDSLNAEDIEWIFNPLSAPHFGGLFELNIKSVKKHLIFLSLLGAKLQDLCAFTPGHFLMQEFSIVYLNPILVQ